MKLYLYETNTGAVRLELDRVLNYTADEIFAETEEGVARFGPFAEGVEFSAKKDCSQTLRADWRQAHLTTDDRLDEVEALLSQILFGSDGGDLA